MAFRFFSPVVFERWEATIDLSRLSVFSSLPTVFFSAFPGCRPTLHTPSSCFTFVSTRQQQAVQETTVVAALTAKQILHGAKRLQRHIFLSFFSPFILNYIRVEIREIYNRRGYAKKRLCETWVSPRDGPKRDGFKVVLIGYLDLIQNQD